MSDVVKFLNRDAAFRAFRLWLVESGFVNVSPIIELNKGRHAIIKTDSESFYCLFKHDPFYTFPKKYELFFDKYPNLNSAGESINVSAFSEAMEHNYTLIFIHHNGAFYKIHPQQILRVHELAKEFYPDGFRRSQDKTNQYKIAYQNGLLEDVNEATLSFPYRLLTRMNI